MRISTPFSKDRLHTHMVYNLWKYLVIVVASIFGWNLIYSVTAYDPPEDKRIDVYIQSSSATQEKADEYLKQIWDSTVPDMEIVQSVILTTSSSDYYGAIQLSVYLMAGEGDIYFLSSEDFKSYASQGVFLPLDDFVKSGAIDISDLDVSGGYVAITDDDGNVTDEMHLYGIPMDLLYGFMDGMVLDNRGMVMCITYANGNDEKVLPFFNELIQLSRAEKPDWLEE